MTKKKTLNDVIGGYRPKAGDEQRFMDKHVIVKHPDRNGNGDDVFQGTNIKYNEREEERHGYDAEKGIEVYEDVETLDENKNHSKFLKHLDGRYNFRNKGQTSTEKYKGITVYNTKYKTKDNSDHHLATTTVNHLTGEVLHRFFKAGKHDQPASVSIKSNLNEDVETLDELSKNTLDSYRVKAKMDRVANKADLDYDKSRKGFDSASEASRKRLIKQAENNISKRDRGAESLRKRGIGEEVESLDELSKDTIKRYVKASKKDLVDAQKEKKALDKKQEKSLVAYLDQKSANKRAGSASSSKAWNKAASDYSKSKKKADSLNLTPDERKRQHDLSNRIGKRRDGLGYADYALKRESFLDRVIQNLEPITEEDLSIEERIMLALDWLPEHHADVVFDLFEALNEDNKENLLLIAEDPEAISDLLDFAIEHKENF